jgi:uncharacterized protein involved in outer membrane biogenesis
MLNKAEEQIMKKVYGILIVLAVLGVAAFFVLNNPLGRLVKIAIEEFGSDLMQAEVRVSSVTISTSDGRGRLNGLVLGNPKGFKTDHALKADTIEIVIEPVSIAQDVVVLHKVLIDSPHIIYEKGDKGNNFDVIQRNIENNLGAKKGGDVDRNKGKKLIIDSFVIRNAKVNYNNTIDIPLPDIVLKNIGKKSGGATPAQVTKAIIVELNAKIAIELAKTAAITSVGGVAIGAGMAVKKLLGK